MGFDPDLFQDEIDEDLLCPVCLSVYENPVIVCSSSRPHSCCTSCIKEWKHRSLKCPLCRGPLTAEWKNDRDKDQKIRGLTCKCDTSQCSWVGTAYDWKVHKENNGCIRMLFRTSCPYPDCKEQIGSSSLYLHQLQCEHRPLCAFPLPQKGRNPILFYSERGEHSLAWFLGENSQLLWIPEWTEKATNGDAKSQYNLGVCYEYGLGTKEDQKQSVEWFKRASDQDFAPAMACYVTLYESLYGQQTEETRRIRERACTLEEPRMLYEKGMMCIDTNPEKADNLFERSAKGNYILGHFRVAMHWYNAKSDRTSREHAAKLLEEVAIRGLAQAQYFYGICCAKGDGVRQRYLDAIRWLQDALSQGYIDAYYQMALYYKDGNILSVPEDPKKAVLFLALAADAGHAGAQFQLAQCYMKGYGIARDELQAIQLCTEAANQNISAAQLYLASYYLRHSRAITIDVVTWYTKAAINGEKEAQYQLGLLFLYGDGVRQDDKEAEIWFSKAAVQGHEDAQKELRVMHQMNDDWDSIL